MLRGAKCIETSVASCPGKQGLSFVQVHRMFFPPSKLAAFWKEPISISGLPIFILLLCFQQYRTIVWSKRKPTDCSV